MNTTNGRTTDRAIDCRDWNGVQIHRRPEDGFVNATGMCKATGTRLNNWLRAARTHEYLQALLADLLLKNPCGSAVARIRATGNPMPSSRAVRNVAGISAPGVEAVVQVVRGGRPELQGTWVHPRLAVDLARWVSPQFAVWMDGWFLDVMQQEKQEGSKREFSSAFNTRFKLLPMLDKNGIDLIADLFAEDVQNQVFEWSRHHALPGYPASYKDFPIQGLRRRDHADPWTVAPIARHFLHWLKLSGPGILLSPESQLIPCQASNRVCLPPLRGTIGQS